jgi:peptide/nickel transport system ATP-binding protein/oligopeptide transport system ATP-binding protein
MVSGISSPLRLAATKSRPTRRDASTSLVAGETVAIVGESGSGKSAGALSILGLIPDPPGGVTAGEFRFAGRDLMALSDAERRQVRGRIHRQRPETISRAGPMPALPARLTILSSKVGR